MWCFFIGIFVGIFITLVLDLLYHSSVFHAESLLRMLYLKIVGKV